ncbi:hypothetical protein B5X24_HaOG210879 [Helicoverpa armigera]|uniref:Odorant receptor n=1 Tax=Helicoverpa armigera TaxID=29058 RepID=A0A2W1BIN5_HELAM|nr:hypothetical protein B5X24_HaOG210879 [Helicoverpa armigera]
MDLKERKIILTFAVFQGMQYHFLFNHAILALFQICAYTWFGEQAIFKGSELRRALLEFDWTSMHRKDKNNYLIIISYMKKDFRIKTAFNNDLCLVTMTSVSNVQADYQPRRLFCSHQPSCADATTKISFLLDHLMLEEN